MLRMKKRVLSLSALRVLRFIAVKGESWQYRISDKGKMSGGTVSSAINELNRLEMIKETRRERRHGKTLKFYYLTFRGLIEVFYHLEEENKKSQNITEKKKLKKAELKKIVEKFNEFHDFTLFQEHEALKEMYETSIYDIFVETGWMLFEAPPPINLFPDIPVPLIQSIRTGKYGEVKKTWKYLYEDYLKYAYSFIFFTFTGRRLGFKPKPNKKLLDYANEIFRNNIKSWMKMLHETQELQRTWQKDLAGN